MTKKTLWDAMHADQPNLEAVEVCTSGIQGLTATYFNMLVIMYSLIKIQVYQCLSAMYFLSINFALLALYIILKSETHA
jgi:hypothetical protein